MAFAFKARVLLELGAELISSDAVAVYELVKNAIDAGSKLVEIDVLIGMQHSTYVQFLDLLKEYQRQEHEKGKTQFEHISFNESVLASLADDITSWSENRFRDSYANPETITDALENLKKAYTVSSRISIKDTGSGMSEKELNNNYLTIGTPERLHEKKRAIDKITMVNSRLHYTATGEKMPLGEKGIGRLSAMRLGHLIRVKTKLQNEESWHRLRLDWRPAFSDPTLNADDPLLNFTPYSRPCRIDEIEARGTTIFIEDIQSDWTVEKVTKIAVNDLAKLADPFVALRANKFIKVTFQEKPVTIPSLDREPLTYCDAIINAKFLYNENKDPVLSLHINYKTYKKEKTIHLSGDHLRACVREEPTSKKKKQPIILVDAEIAAHALKHLGPWEMEFYWFNRGRIQRHNRELYDTTIKGFLDQWAGGLLVYRDGFRVYPYGERSDDWLDLDRRALASTAFKLNRAQIVGRLKISTIANPTLLDQTNREGFRDSSDKEALRRLLRYAIIGFSRGFLDEVEKEAKPPIDVVVADVEKRITTSKEAALCSLKEIKQRVPQESKNIASVLYHLEEVSEAWERAKLRIKDFDREIEGYIHLAGVGLMLEFIAHELTRVTQDTLKAVVGGRMAPEVVEAQLRTLEKRVRILDELSIPGRQIRRTASPYELASMLVDFHQAKALRHDIQLELLPKSPSRKWEARVEKGQILQILDNLLSNSFYWLLNRLDKSAKGHVTVEVSQNTREIRVTDNGPGIPADRAEDVFSQFFTTKPPREGRGLGLFIARRLAEENGATLSLAEPDENGIHHTFLLRFEA